MSALSKKLMPSSRAASTTLAVPAASTDMPKLLQPTPARETFNPEFPSFLYSIAPLLRVDRR
jgi:hypothetical protein